MPDLKLPPRAASVSELLYAATSVFRRTLAKGLPVGMFAILLAALPNLYWLTRGKPLDFMHLPTDGRFWLLTAIGFAGYQLLAAVLMLRQRALLGGAAPSLAREFAVVRTRWPVLLVSALLMGVLVFAGFMALVVPGIVALVCLLILRPVVLFENVDPLRALQRCFRLAWPMWIKMFASALIAALVFAICAVAAAACLGILQSVLLLVGVQQQVMIAFAAACGLGIQAVALVYLNALWLVLYSAASSSA
jgi:hypothetical protein